MPPLLATTTAIILLGIIGELARRFSSTDDGPLPETLRLVRRFVGISGEQTVGAWFSASLLLACGLGLFAVAGHHHASGGPHVRRWRGLGAIFLFLSADEAIAFHEEAGEWVKGVVETGGVLLWAWVIPYAVLTLVITAAYHPLVHALPPAIRRQVTLAAALFVSGALGLEMVQAELVDARGHGGPVTILAVIEEACEMLGALLFLNALLRLLGDTPSPATTVQAGPDPHHLAAATGSTG
jgi:hypothetical protein